MSDLSDGDLCTLAFALAAAWAAARRTAYARPDAVPAMRLWGTAGFLAAAARVYLTLGAAGGGELVGAVGYAAVAGLLASLAAAAVQPAVAAAFGGVRRWRAGARAAAERRADDHRRAAEARDREAAWERGRPARDAADRDRVRRDRSAAADRRRRDAARSECLLYYHLHSPEFGTRFSRAQFDEYVRAYLRDDMTPDAVERHASRLRTLMAGHLEKAGVRDEPTDVSSLAAWYRETKARIEGQDVEERLKRVQLAKLSERYAELVQEHIEDLEP